MIEALFRQHFGTLPDRIARAPGRVNLIGEHTDYNDGFVLPCAISRQTMAAVRMRGDGVVNLVAGDLGGLITSFSVCEPIRPDTDAPWANYVRGMVDGLLAEGVEIGGADIAIAGNMPQGTGLSSSAALEMAVGLALAPEMDLTRLAQIGQRAEHLFAGCKCGIMDQLVSASAKEGAALLIDCRNLEAQPVAIPQDCVILVVQSGIERGLVDGEYNARRSQCEAAAHFYGVAALRDLAELPDQAGLDEVSFRRARHVITENARTLACALALNAGDLHQIGIYMAQSHASMRDDFDITSPAIDRLAALMQDAIGDQGGARMTGGGFGGAVVGLCPAGEADRVSKILREHYVTPQGREPDIMIEHACAGASLIL